jgi:hypothetical protein
VKGSLTAIRSASAREAACADASFDVVAAATLTTAPRFLFFRLSTPL